MTSGRSPSDDRKLAEGANIRDTYKGIIDKIVIIRRVFAVEMNEHSATAEAYTPRVPDAALHELSLENLIKIEKEEYDRFAAFTRERLGYTRLLNPALQQPMQVVDNQLQIAMLKKLFEDLLGDYLNLHIKLTYLLLNEIDSCNARSENLFKYMQEDIKKITQENDALKSQANLDASLIHFLMEQTTELKTVVADITTQSAVLQAISTHDKEKLSLETVARKQLQKEVINYKAMLALKEDELRRFVSHIEAQDDLAKKNKQNYKELEKKMKKLEQENSELKKEIAPLKERKVSKKTLATKNPQLKEAPSKLGAISESLPSSHSPHWPLFFAPEGTQTQPPYRAKGPSNT